MGREIQPWGSRGTEVAGGLYPMRSVSASPPHCLLGSLCPWASPPSWWVSTPCPSPQVLGSWMRWVVGAPGHPPPLPPLLPLPQPKLTPQEKLKLRMQKALNRQCMSPHLSLGSSKPPFLPAWPWGGVGTPAALLPLHSASGGRHCGAQSKWGLFWVPVSHRDPPSPQSRRIRRPLRRR